MSNVIVLEGCDGTGKTTLANWLSARLDWEYLHQSKPEPINQPFQYWMKRIEAKLLFNPNGLIIDRLHWSGDVYSNVFKEQPKISRTARWLLESWLMAHGAIVVYCRPPLDVVWENVLQRPNDIYHNDVAMVYNEYEQPWNTCLPVIEYDYTSQTRDATKLEILAQLINRKHLPFSHSPPTQWECDNPQHASRFLTHLLEEYMIVKR